MAAILPSATASNELLTVTRVPLRMIRPYTFMGQLAGAAFRHVFELGDSAPFLRSECEESARNLDRHRHVLLLH
jgi:hypothetical protein